jgi:hypothetical protein
MAVRVDDTVAIEMWRVFDAIYQNRMMPDQRIG